MTHKAKWLAMVIHFTLATATALGGSFSASSISLPYRAVAATEDAYALRHNPAGLAFDTPVELAFLHQFSRIGPGGDNALIFRAKNLAASVSWIKNRGFGKRREYMVGAGHALAPNLSFGTTYNYLKADAPELNNTHTWTHSLLYRHSPMMTVGLRWENPWHTEIAGASTDGQITAGISVTPVGPRLTASLDWTVPDGGPFKDSYVRGSALVRVSQRVDMAAFADSEGFFGIEFRWLRQRSAMGIELSGEDLTDYDWGTVYLSAQDREYRPQRTPGVAKIR